MNKVHVIVHLVQELLVVGTNVCKIELCRSNLCYKVIFIHLQHNNLYYFIVDTATYFD